MKTLVAYASAHGSTAEIAQFIGRLLQAYGADVTVLPVGDVHDVSSYDLVIAGSAIHGNMWLQSMSVFLDHFKEELKGKATYVFITCIRVLEPNGREHALKEYIYHPVLEHIGIHLDKVGVLAGRIEIGQITWDERWLLASKYDGTEGSKLMNHDYRNWGEIGRWVSEIADAQHLVPTFA